MPVITLKIDEKLLKRVKNKIKKEVPLKNFNTYASAVREVLHRFIEKKE